ncbi:CAP domain-containing protein [Streptacidiphilus sp. P02-A3a]|uniref:CAP domain-containing protein n=1 Tax=Streptacidiphilus sp. P02-A3a TaxID=2704468 RepID=UPI0015FCE8D4|nr:CAP domain-containing protein [Streptacidiphilus sp. P02-A3a]QMU72350.1 CAP domain-containing protein [Streptacidiphilus sp. P02-A3a]
MSRHACSAHGSCGDHTPGRRAGQRTGRTRRTSGRAPRIVAALCGTALAAGAPFAAAVPAAAAPVTGVRLAPAVDTQADSAQRQVLTLVNTQRSEHRCGALSASSRLNRMATDYSAEMGTENFFSHTDPAGRTPWDRAKDMGISDFGGENIAVGQPTPRAVMDAWMNSSKHRANILDCRFHSLGVGVYYGDGGPWWTQDFGY